MSEALSSYYDACNAYAEAAKAYREKVSAVAHNSTPLMAGWQFLYITGKDARYPAADADTRAQVRRPFVASEWPSADEMNALAAAAKAAWGLLTAAYETLPDRGRDLVTPPQAVHEKALRQG